MKKTIAILLVLVIGMAGVFAATADLNLITTVFEFSELKITESDTPIEWNSWANATDGNFSSTYTGTANESRKEIDPYITTAQNVGYLNTRTNRRGGYNVTVSATALTSTEGTTVQDINYEIYNDTTATAVYIVGTTPSAATFVSEGVGQGMRSKQTPISVKLLTTGDDLSSGTYTGDITFTYTGN
jgi:hypothetical protein